MNLIKGLKNGFFHTWVTGDSKYRKKIFEELFKVHVDNGEFIRDIQNAPRDARYKIDYYYNDTTSEEHTLPYDYMDSIIDVINFLNIDETFNWKKYLIDEKREYNYNDFTIGYGEYEYEIFSDDIINCFGYYFKYKGEINTLLFQNSPKLVDYSDSFWKKYKNKPQYYEDVSTLIHNIGYFMEYKGII